VDNQDHLRGSLRALRHNKNTCSTNDCFSRYSLFVYGRKIYCRYTVFFL